MVRIMHKQQRARVNDTKNQSIRYFFYFALLSISTSFKVNFIILKKHKLFHHVNNFDIFIFPRTRRKSYKCDKEKGIPSQQQRKQRKKKVNQPDVSFVNQFYNFQHISLPIVYATPICVPTHEYAKVISYTHTCLVFKYIKA